MSTKKQDRQLLILDIINSQTIDTQEKLMAELKARGVDVTQATVSRDINELQIVRQIDNNGVSRYQALEPMVVDELSQLRLSVEQLVESVTQIEFMVVIKTLPGNGNRLGALLDDVGFPEIAGTLAGHDTIFMMTHSDEQAKKMTAMLKNWL
ncbi:transcriptional regulator of arginine metabolism [Weissella uvarum]|uniref:arginine repressor n=1 Tax=Weissella uvarum TaxID=1479233 RepID=UPI001960C5F2|nr:arginine repressor [Weissella uvarum]MBM7617141.1 transcriptional regulator of arginine metabolism [Weissella uvarum]MCM0595437.1 arginine repressor [Weissella uvarum]